MTIKTRQFEAANYLNGPEYEADLIGDAMADGDARYIAAARDAALRAHSDRRQNSALRAPRRAARKF